MHPKLKRTNLEDLEKSSLDEIFTQVGSDRLIGMVHAFSLLKPLSNFHNLNPIV